MEAAKKAFKTLLLALGLLPAYLLPAGALSLSEIRSNARVLALDAGASRQRYTDAQVNSFINEGQRLAVLDAKPLVKSSQFELVAGTTYYSLPADFLQMYRLTYKHETIQETTPEALDKQALWPETGQRPTHYFIQFASRTKVGMYPWPESSSSTGTVRFEYYATATDLTADAEEPYGGSVELDQYGYALAYYAAARMAAIDGRLDLAAFYLGEFRAGVDRMGREAKNRPSYRPAAVGRRE